MAVQYSSLSDLATDVHHCLPNVHASSALHPVTGMRHAYRQDGCQNVWSPLSKHSSATRPSKTACTSQSGDPTHLHCTRMPQSPHSTAMSARACPNSNWPRVLQKVLPTIQTCTNAGPYVTNIITPLRVGIMCDVKSAISSGRMPSDLLHRPLQKYTPQLVSGLYARKRLS